MSWSVSANLDQLQKLEGTDDDYILHNYKWLVVYPDIPNRVKCEFGEDEYKQAKGIYDRLYALKLVCFRNWI